MSKEGWITLECTAWLRGERPLDLENRILFGPMINGYDTRLKMVAPGLFERLTGRKAPTAEEGTPP